MLSYPLLLLLYVMSYTYMEAGPKTKKKSARMIRMVWQLWITRGLFAQEERSWWPNSTQILLEYTWWNIKRGEMRKSRNENQIIVDSRLHIPPSALSFTAMTSSSHHSLLFLLLLCVISWILSENNRTKSRRHLMENFNYVLHRHALYASHNAELSHIWEKLHTMEYGVNYERLFTETILLPLQLQHRHHVYHKKKLFPRHSKAEQRKVENFLGRNFPIFSFIFQHFIVFCFCFFATFPSRSSLQ